MTPKQAEIYRIQADLYRINAEQADRIGLKGLAHKMRKAAVLAAKLGGPKLAGR